MTQKEKAKAYHDIVKMVNAEAAYILERENESHYNDISARAITAASLSAMGFGLKKNKRNGWKLHWRLASGKCSNKAAHLMIGT